MKSNGTPRPPRNYRTDGRPRGVRSVPSRAREAVELHAGGMTRHELAERFAVAVSTIDWWFEVVREANEDSCQ